ncbi:MAG: homocysteine S-methyltransferase family protein [Oligoflexia bacterium]|nr:homocysteine S-methyltransferase family protein [Oligoflexia bacterium]
MISENHNGRQLLEEIIKNQRTVLADGAMGTMLMKMNALKSGDCPEELNLTRPQILKEIAKLYLAEGATLIQTNTFGGSPLKLKSYHLQDKTETINILGVKVVRDAIDEYLARRNIQIQSKDNHQNNHQQNQQILIAASVGPTGELLKPMGMFEPETIYQAFREQISALLKGGADIISIETMSDVTEASLAVKASKDLSPSTPVIASMTFDQTPRGFFTFMGVSVERACKKLTEAGADIIGSNCGNGFDRMIILAKEFKKHSSIPLMFRSNAGVPITGAGGEISYSQGPDYFREKVQELLAVGVSIVGGCCGTTPEHIRAMRDGVMKDGVSNEHR